MTRRYRDVDEPYVQDVLIRERIADAQQRAARNHLLRRARPRGAPGGAWERLRYRACAIFRLTPSHGTTIKGVTLAATGQQGSRQDHPCTSRGTCRFGIVRTPRRKPLVWPERKRPDGSPWRAIIGLEGVVLDTADADGRFPCSGSARLVWPSWTRTRLASAAALPRRADGRRRGGAVATHVSQLPATRQRPVAR